MRTIKANTGTTFYSYTHVDNFSITPGVGVTSVLKAFATEPYPNPFSKSLRFSLGDGVTMPCQATLRDMTGRIVYEESTSTRDVQIERGKMSAGIYLLTVRNAAGKSAFSRIIAE